MRDKSLLKIADRYLGVPLCFLAGLYGKRSDLSGGTVAQSDRRPRRVLIIKLSAVGDSILAVPAWRALRTHFRDATFTILCSSITLDTVRTFPFFDEIIRLDLERYVKHPIELPHFVSDLRQRHFDLVVDFDQWMRTTALVALATGAARRVGFDTRDQYRRFAYTHTVRPPKQRHEVDNFLDLAELAGAPRGSRKLQLWIPEEDTAWARKILNPSSNPRSIVIGFHPGCGGAGRPREWPPEFYSELGNWLTRRYPEMRIALTGSPGERPLVDRIARLMERPCIRLVESYSLTRFAALLGEFRVLVCGNTGPMHISAAVGTPVVALHGPTNSNKWGPVGNQHTVIQSPIACSPCLDLGFDYGCTTHPCMRMISVERVFNAVTSYL